MNHHPTNWRDFVKFKHLLKGKVFCDLGCGIGNLLVMAQRHAECKEIIGVELDPYRAKMCRVKGFRIIEGDATDKNIIPKADIYYCWLYDQDNKKVFDAVKEGEIIIHKISEGAYPNEVKLGTGRYGKDIVLVKK